MTTTATHRTHRNWVWVLAAGIISIVAGILALALPGVTVLVLAVLLGIALLMSSVFEFGAFSRAAKGTPGRGWALFFGIVCLLAGLNVLFHPGAGVFAIVIGIAVWFAVAGVNELMAGFMLRENRTWNIVLGVLNLILAIVLLVNPGAAIGTVAVVAGILFIIRGVGQIMLATWLRRLSA